MTHAAGAATFLQDRKIARFHDEVLWRARGNRDRSIEDVPEWEALRELAGRIKDHALAHLDEYLIRFEERARSHGIQVHWAATAADHNRIVMDILASAGARRVVKSKSMLTEECGLNHVLETAGIEVTDTDLGERIVQMRGEPPSHIVTPAIHVMREQISELFHERLGTEKGNIDPAYLTGAARAHMREKFLDADAAITGGNFGIAETGAVVVCTNEGNADMGVALAPLHIACMGIEKVIPRAADLGVFLRLLARSATGQPSTVYAAHYHGPRAGGAMHVVLVDNGRSSLLGNRRHRRSLACIRCGACLNTCPVFRRSGGYSYGYALSGPIGSILAPARDIHRHADLPFASSLCGSCSDVCPVRIDIHGQLLEWRREVAEAGALPPVKRLAARVASQVMRRPRLFNWAGRMASLAMRLPRPILYNLWNVWGRQRELPPVASESFHEWYLRHRGGGQ